MTDLRRQVGASVLRGALLGLLVLGAPVADAAAEGTTMPVDPVPTVTTTPAVGEPPAPASPVPAVGAAQGDPVAQSQPAPSLPQPEVPAVVTPPSGGVQVPEPDRPGAAAADAGAKEGGAQETGQSGGAKQEGGQKESGPKDSGQKGDKDDGQKGAGQKEDSEKGAGQKDATQNGSGQKEAGAEERSAAASPGGPGEEAPRDVPAAAGLTHVAPAPAAPAEAVQPPRTQVAAAVAEPAPAVQPAAAGPRAAHPPVVAGPVHEQAGRTAPPGLGTAPLGAAPPTIPALAQPLAAPPSASHLEVARAAAERSARASEPDHPPKRRARDIAKGDPVPSPSPTPPGGGGHAAASAAGGGGAAPELPGILIVLLAASGLPAFQRHRIALVVQSPTACSKPLERPG